MFSPCDREYEGIDRCSSPMRPFFLATDYEYDQILRVCRFQLCRTLTRQCEKKRRSVGEYQLLRVPSTHTGCFVLGLVFFPRRRIRVFGGER